MQELQSSLDAAKARLAAEEASLRLEKDRLDRDKEQLENCVITGGSRRHGDLSLGRRVERRRPTSRKAPVFASSKRC